MIIDEKWIKEHCDEDTFKKAKKFSKRNDGVRIFEIKMGYTEYFYENAYFIFAAVNDSRSYGYTRCDIVLSVSGQFSVDCNGFGHWYLHREELCEHSAAILLYLLDYFKENPLTYTHPMVRDMIGQFSLANIDLQQPVHLEPVIDLSGENLKCEIKIGHDKKYIIKNLYDFISRFDNYEEMGYGKDLTFIHDEKDIYAKDLPLYYLIKQIVKEAPKYIKNKYNEYTKDLIKITKSIDLSYQTLDTFFDLYENQTLVAKPKEYKSITLRNSMPHLEMSLSKIKKDQKEMIELQIEEIQFYYGLQYSYIIKNHVLYRSDTYFHRQLSPFLRQMARFGYKMMIEEEDMSSFYAKVLPVLKQYFNIEIRDFNEEDYLPPEIKYQFYLDYLKDHELKPITIDAQVNVDGKSYDLIHQRDYPGYHDQEKEILILNLIGQYFFVSPNDGKVVISEQEEEKVYDFLNEGLLKLEQLGEVYIDQNLKSLRVHYSPKITVGVRLESNLLKMDIDVEGMNLAEITDVLKSYKQKKKYHRLKDGGFISLDDQNIETLATLSESLNLKELGKKTLEIPAFRAIYLDRLLNENEAIDYDRDQHIRNLLRDFKTIDDSEFVVPEKFSKILRPYQKKGFQWLKILDHYHFGGILADDMGLGKTLQMITFLYDYYIQNEAAFPSMIVSPASLVYNWKEEFEKFAPELTVELIVGSTKERKEKLEKIKANTIYITSYDLLKRDVALYQEHHFAYEIIDEAQYIKNSTTLQAKAVKAIQSENRFALTGTPIENRLSELWSIFDFLMPGFLYPYATFKKVFENEIVKHQNEQQTSRLQKMVGPFILRRVKKDVLKDLPDKIEKLQVVAIEGEQKKLYDNYAAKVKMSLGSQSEQEVNNNKIKILSDLMRLRQLCCDPALIYEDYHGGSAKLDQCLELVESCVEANHKMLIFSQFTTMLDLLKAELDKRNIASYTIKGETNKEKRLAYVKAFNEDDTPVFLISLKAGGTGLNLTGADIVIHYDPWWNVAAQNQATDRAHRIGQKNVVTVYQMITKGTIEEKIVELQKSKQELVDQVLTGQTSSISSLSKEELLDILS